MIINARNPNKQAKKTDPVQHSAEKSLLMVHLNCFSVHMNWISPSSSGSFHFKSTVEQSTTSAFKNKPRASLYSQSSGAGCFCVKESKTHTKNQNQTSLFNCRNFWIVADINSLWGQCFLRSPQCSRAVWSGQWLSWGQFPWWCRSSHSPAEYTGLWTRMDHGKKTELM